MKKLNSIMKDSISSAYSYASDLQKNPAFSLTDYEALQLGMELVKLEFDIYYRGMDNTRLREISDALKGMERRNRMP